MVARGIHALSRRVGVTLLLFALAVVALVATASAQRHRTRRARAHQHHERPQGLRPTVSEQPLGGGETYRLHAFHINLSEVVLGVVDVGMSREITPALEREGAMLVFNGGYFDARMRPEGLVIADGRTVAPFVQSMGGGVLSIRNGVATLHDGETFSMTMLWGADFGMQCKPRLVVDRAVNIRSDDGHRADRTAMCLRNNGRELDVYIARTENVRGADGPTLQSFAQTLQRLGCENALNLDGGPSTGASWRQDDEVRTLPPRGSIRHAITVRRRHS